MALVECTECKAKISTSAQRCPQCGAFTPRARMDGAIAGGIGLAYTIGCFVFILIVLAVVFGAAG